MPTKCRQTNELTSQVLNWWQRFHRLSICGPCAFCLRILTCCRVNGACPINATNTHSLFHANVYFSCLVHVTGEIRFEWRHRHHEDVGYFSFADDRVLAKHNKRSLTYTTSRQTRVADSPPRSVIHNNNNNNNHNTLSSKRNQNHAASIAFSIQHTIAWWCMMMCYSQFNVIRSVCGLRQSDTIRNNLIRSQKEIN